jgi:hypothetical protein
MGRSRWFAWLGAWMLLAAGCASGPLQDNPILVRPDLPTQENPVYIPLGPKAYGMVFEKVLDVVDDYFEIAYSNRYDGRIETFPRIAPGVAQPWRAGSPDMYQRVLASFQTIQHRAIVKILPAPDGGYFVDVKVYKELEDLERPIAATAGPAIIRGDQTIARQFEVVDASVFQTNWIPIGRDIRLEQQILCKLANFQPPRNPPP